MGIFYHIDRLNKLQEGNEINLIMYKDLKGETQSTTTLLQNQVDNMFEDGVSSHGEQYFISGSMFNDTSVDIELIFELYRRIYFPEKISRFQAFYCVEKENLKSMLQRLRVNINNVSVFEIQSDVFEKHDMNLLLKNSNLVNTIYADLYWKGKSIQDPLYEILVKPPFKVGKKVNIKDILNN
ncbi:DUF2441 domain-containing protein [Clostridium cadaveris]|uniref:DUF2441 domain-containing protein n=1 Tax=Clostridium cadaveris TaxID=1529 RepID=UPI001459D798|nr:DUF2441 domain-containing protein [Clostridium cadaveris]NME64457.1 DUF2441 domain-containing protein [Clostridium cadaveris]